MKVVQFSVRNILSQVQRMTLTSQLAGLARSKLLVDNPSAALSRVLAELRVASAVMKHCRHADSAAEEPHYVSPENFPRHATPLHSTALTVPFSSRSSRPYFIVLWTDLCFSNRETGQNLFSALCPNKNGKLCNSEQRSDRGQPVKRLMSVCNMVASHDLVPYIQSMIQQVIVV